MGFKDVAKQMLLDGLKNLLKPLLDLLQPCSEDKPATEESDSPTEETNKDKDKPKDPMDDYPTDPDDWTLRKMFVRRLRQRIIQVEDIVNGKIKKQEKQFDVGIRKDEKTEKSDLLIGMIILKMMVQRISRQIVSRTQNTLIGR